jgi:Protein of unknown function (DUF1161)
MFFIRHLACLAPVLVCAAATAQGLDCETLRGQIDSKISAGGVSRYSLTVVDSAASAPGREVGRCQRGSKKIMYRLEAASSAPAGLFPVGAPPPVPAPPAAFAKPSPPAALAKPKPPASAASDAKDSAVLTECRDGSEPEDGQCPD